MFDTNILLMYVRESETVQEIERRFNAFSESNRATISVVTSGEIKSIALRNKWGSKKKKKLKSLISRFIVIDLNFEEVIDRYAEIDAFSQGRLDNKSLLMSSRNMGKNDLRIAATASVLDATLLTTDNDFDHLHKEYFEVEKISINI